MTQLTYPNIASGAHPRATGKRVAASLSSGMQKETTADIAIAAEILAIDARLTRYRGATGEWRWINDNKRKNYLQTLEEGDSAHLARCLVNMFRNDASYGIISSDFEIVKKSSLARKALESRILLDLDALREFDEDYIEESWLKSYKTCGNLYGYLAPDKSLVGVDDARHRYFAHKIRRLLTDSKIKNPTILEVGGGYGGLCYQLMHKPIKGSVFVNCDLPETLYLAYFFLKRSLPKKIRIAWAFDSIPTADVILLPAHKKDLIKRADLYFNANSFSEMSESTLRGYMTLLHRLAPKFFLHQNSNFILFPDSPRHIEIPASQFPIRESRFKRMYAAIAPWQGAGGRYREYLYIRNGKK